MGARENRLTELEALRGLMAVWVLLGHVAHILPMANDPNWLVHILIQNGLPVDVFIILSGFVIFSLLDTGREQYGTFIARRALRIFPCYAACLVVSIFMMDSNREVLESLPWSTDRVEQLIRISDNTREFFLANLISHAFMMQGAVPAALVPDGEFAFIGPAWSVSLEWQFYLIAPLVFFICTRAQKSYVYVLVLCVVLASYFSTHWFGMGYLFKHAGYFLIGIISYFVWRARERLSPRVAMTLFPVILASAYLFLQSWIPIVIWASVFTSMIVNRARLESFPENAIGAVMNSPPLQWLGRISYSVYMTHMIVINFILQCVNPSAVSGWTYNTTVFVGSIAGTLLISEISYRLIERPAIQFGKRLSQSAAADGRAPQSK